MKPSIRLGNVVGVEVRVHYTLFVMLALVSWSLANRMLLVEFPGWSTSTYWMVALLSGVLLFASVLVHELAHSLVAKSRGIEVDGITLFLLGGVSNMKSEPVRPWDEFIVSVIGPLTSLVLAFGFGFTLLGYRGGDSAPDASVIWFITRISVNNGPAAAVIWYLALINLLLAVFNLLPAFPLDGGRILRSVIWGFTGSLSKATNVAARSGQVLGVAMIGVAFLQVLQGYILGGLWLGIIGWFIHDTSTNSRKESMTNYFVYRIKVKDLMIRNPVTITPDISVADAVYNFFLKQNMRSIFVCEWGRLVGILSLMDLNDVSRDHWWTVTVRDKMTPIPLKQVKPNDELSSALSILGGYSINQLPVMKDGFLVGSLTRTQIISYLYRLGERGIL